MKKYLTKKYQNAKLYFDNARTKAVIRVWNLATRLDPKQNRNQGEKKK